MKNYTLLQLDGLKETIKEKGRIVLKEELNLTGSEVSMNFIPANGFLPFVHSHKQNEELYIVLSGTGLLKVDDEELVISDGDIFRIATKGERALKATTDLSYICIQAKENSLSQYTEEDGIICDSKATWFN